MLEALTYICPVCCSEVETAADPSQGSFQRYVEDCQVCCRPLILQVTIENDHAYAVAEPESE